VFKRWFLKLREIFYKKLHKLLATRAIRTLIGYCSNTFCWFKGALIGLGTQVKACLVAASQWVAHTLAASKISVLATISSTVASIPAVLAGIAAITVGSWVVEKATACIYQMVVITPMHSPALRAAA